MRGSVQADLAKQGEIIQQAMLRLSFGLQMAGDITRMSSQGSSTSALNRSDLLQWQQENQEAIAAEMQTWTASQKSEIENGFQQVLHVLEVHAKENALKMQIGFLQAQSGIEKNTEMLNQLMQAVQRLEGASPASAPKAAWKYQFIVLPLVALEIDWDDEDTACIGSGAAGEVWRGTMQNADEVVPIAFKKLELPKGLPAASKDALLLLVKREAQLMWLLNGHPSTVELYGAVMEKKVGLVFAYLRWRITRSDRMMRRRCSMR
jgi:hypothetical protein